MLQAGKLWFVIADGRRALLFIEERRGAALQADWRMALEPEDRADPTDRPPRSFESVGPARHGMGKDPGPHEQAEARFLRRVAARIAEAEMKGEFAHLAVAAPPRALGLLRENLPHAVAARLRTEIAKDLLAEDAASLRVRLSEALR